MPALPLKSAAAQMLTVSGVWGQLGGLNNSPSVLYLETVVSPAANGTPESELAELLVPVREVFDLDKLTFDQILQRDLDDHRVATELVPYLLSRPDVPRFFPPILAVVVPFAKNEVLNDYGARDEKREPLQEGWETHTSRFGDIFRLSRTFEISEGKYRRDGAELGLNRHRAKLMVVDGQHRAMAMLAIQRNWLNSWDKSGGEEYKHFYSDIDLSGISVEDLSRIELPVCICMFPDIPAKSAGGLRDVCRKIFLDVNRNARKPSESRNILLDDYDLRAVFTRAVFSLAKMDSGPVHAGNRRLRLRHVEYDNPHDRIQAEKDVALTNVRTIEAAIEWMLVREDDFYTDMTKGASRGQWKRNNARMQRVLGLDEVVSADERREWGITGVSDIRVDAFPHAARGILGDAFGRFWGEVILKFFSTYVPYKKHIEAVDSKATSTAAETGAAKLARQALFEGQGLYFTLQEYTEGRRLARRDNPELPGSKAEQAWGILGGWVAEILQSRAELLLGASKADAVALKRVNRVYNVLRTQAFQIGALMALASLLEVSRSGYSIDVIGQWIDAASAAWAYDGVRDRLLDREAAGLLSVYPGQLSPADWPFFRYLFLEQILYGGESLDPAHTATVGAIVDLGRVMLFEKVKRHHAEQAKRDGEKLSDTALTTKARTILRQALKKSLNVTAEQCDTSLQRGGDALKQLRARKKGQSSDATTEGDAESETTEYMEPAAREEGIIPSANEDV